MNVSISCAPPTNETEMSKPETLQQTGIMQCSRGEDKASGSPCAPHAFHLSGGNRKEEAHGFCINNLNTLPSTGIPTCPVQVSLGCSVCCSIAGIWVIYWLRELTSSRLHSFRWSKREFLLVCRVTWQVHFSIFHDRYVMKLKWIEENVVFSRINLF